MTACLIFRVNRNHQDSCIIISLAPRLYTDSARQDGRRKAHFFREGNNCLSLLQTF
jgi:hypothetical protein